MAAIETAFSWSFWPLVVAAGTWATYCGFASGQSLPLVFILVGVGLIVVVGTAEQIFPRRPDTNALTDRQSINDLAHALIGGQIGERLGALVFLTLAAGVAGGMSGLVGHALWPSEWPLVGQIVLVLVVADGLDYWKHRFLHTVPALWRIHALHHGITQLHVLKSARNHFLDVLSRFPMVYAPLVVLGTPAPIIFWYTSFISVLRAIGHSNVRLQIPSPVHRLLMTPHVHWLHHSIERSVSDSNYANILPIWDIVFGTFSAPEQHELVRVGTVDDPVPSGIVGQLLSPFVWNRLTKEARARGQATERAAVRRDR